MRFNKLSEFEEYHKWEKYRWEFMRRSKEYRQAYKKALKLRALAKKKHPHLFTAKYNKKNLAEVKNLKSWQKKFPSYGITVQGQKEKKLAEKFYIRLDKLPDPNKAWDDLEMRQRILFALVLNQKALRLWEFPQESGKVKIEIDFNRINSIDSLKRKICERIDEYVNMHPEHRSKEYWKNFDRFLKVGDLKNRNMTFGEIAERVFSESDNFDTLGAKESAKKKAQNDFKEYKKFVSGGYRNITFP